MSYEAELAFGKDMARQAGDIMRRYFRSDMIDTTWKSDATPVTAADTAINQLVIESVQKSFPDHGVIGEEDSYEQERSMVWVVDPVDGTSPFSLGIPASTFLLALVDRHDGQPVLGIVYDPYLDELYTAIRGEGAFLNGRLLKCSSQSSLEKSYIAIYGPAVSTETIDYSPGRVIDELTTHGANTYRLSSGAYTGAKIATGQFTAIVMGNGNPWDSAAIAIVVEEAGGKATDLVGKTRRYDETGLGSVIAANEAVLQQLLVVIRGK
jgi:myo-inositol-1(or 4)-monophosphatase